MNWSKVNQPTDL